MLLDNIMAVDADETIVADEMAALEFADAQSEFDDACAACDELQLATILGEAAEDFIALDNAEALAAAQKMFARFGEGCTVEGLGSKIKEFGEKSLEVLKQLWAKFTELIKRMFVNASGKLKKFRKLRAKVGGFGKSIKWINENKRVFLYTKGSLLDQIGKMSKEDALDVAYSVNALIDFNAALKSGVWNIKGNDSITVSNRKFWEEYKEAVRDAKDKGDSWSASDYKETPKILFTIEEAVEAGNSLEKKLEAYFKIEREVKAVKIKQLSVKEDTVDPKVFTRRMTRTISLVIITLAKQLGGVNAILANAKKA